MIELLRNKNARLIILNTLFSGLGSGIIIIGVSWYLVQLDPKNGGSLGFPMLISAIATFFLAPYLGVFIDRYSRKRFFMGLQLSMIVLNTALVIAGILFSFNLFVLTLIYLTGTLYFTVHYPVLNALVQELFSSTQYKEVNSLLEIEGQTASMVSGALAAILLTPLGLTGLLWINVLLYVLSAITLFFISYHPKEEVANRGKKRIMMEFLEGLDYLNQNQKLAWFFLLTFSPYLLVLMSNYLNPIYVSIALDGQSSTFAIAEFTYAFGAIVIGFLIQQFSKRFSDTAQIIIFMFLFGISFYSLSILHFNTLLWTVMAIMGFCNAGSRIIRNTLIMIHVPPQYLGRVNTTYQVITTLFRVVLLTVFSGIMSNDVITYLYAGLGVALLLFSIISLPLSKSVILEQTTESKLKAVK
ncbi:MFS transporter [Fictibacillus barbaricus]|uniref:MFS family permease n=1 Tax=Fictibacillus barbaricus TaxID=182136 RepID=A0ABU1U3Z9_9BACL|nr:MFS transporter [Fictibacillus barbaricus]MDR7074215.1 MFS family permease [Fictibacillus barbaricus]